MRTDWVSLLALAWIVALVALIAWALIDTCMKGERRALSRTARKLQADRRARLVKMLR